MPHSHSKSPARPAPLTGSPGNPSSTGQATGTGGKSHADKLLLILLFTLILSVMNATMFNVVLPQIRVEFQLAPSQVSWVMTSYSILYAIGTVIFGKLSDRYKLKNLITFGLLFFAGGSIVGLLSSSFWMVILGRVLQAAGASVIPAIAMIIPVRYFSLESRGKALGMVAVGLAIGNAAAPIVGGFIAGSFHWRFLFGLTLLVLLTLPLYRRYLKDEPQDPSPIDIIGAALLAGTVASLLLAVTWSSLPLALVGAGLLLLFIWRISRAAHPFIQPSLMRNGPYTIALAIGFLNTGVVMGIPFLAPQLLADVNGLEPSLIGFVLFPGAIISALLGRSAGKLADRKGSPFLVSIALSLLFVCFATLSLLAGAQPWVIAIVLMAGNLGQTFMQIGLSNTISRTLAPHQVGIGMGLFSMNMFLSGAVSTVLIGKVLDYGNKGMALNPLRLYERGAAFSNISVVMAIIIVVVAGLYLWRFGLGKADKLEAAAPAKAVR